MQASESEKRDIVKKNCNSSIRKEKPRSVKIFEALFLIIWAVPIVFTATLLLSGMNFALVETTFLRGVLILFSIYEGGWLCYFFLLPKVWSRKTEVKSVEDG